MSATNTPVFAAPNYELPKKGRSKVPVVIVSLLVLGVLAVGAFFYLDKTVGLDNGQTFLIPGASMEPTIEVNDQIITSDISAAEEVERGWVVVLKRPDTGDYRSEPETIVKRVVGLPGDTVEAKGGIVYINDRPISEPYLPPGTSTLQLQRTTVPANSYFVLGDSRENSADSRFFGPVDRSLIKYKAEKIISPRAHRRNL